MPLHSTLTQKDKVHKQPEIPPTQKEVILLLPGCIPMQKVINLMQAVIVLTLGVTVP